MNITNEYYKQNLDSFIDNTISCDMMVQYDFFLKHLKGNVILDCGFGSGRDSLYFSNNYEVYAIDPVKEFCDKLNSYNKDIKVFNLSVLDMNFSNTFDGVWCCASLLHVSESDLSKAFKILEDSLKEDGVIYCSFKYGTFKGIRNGRYFIDLNEESIKQYLSETNLEVKDTLITEDVRGTGQKWLNVILKSR